MVHGATSHLLSHFSFPFGTSKLSDISDIMPSNIYGILLFTTNNGLYPAWILSVHGECPQLQCVYQCHLQCPDAILHLSLRQESSWSDSHIIIQNVGRTSIGVLPRFSIVHYRLSIAKCQYGFQWWLLFIFQLLSVFDRWPFTLYHHSPFSIYISRANLSWLNYGIVINDSTWKMEAMVQYFTYGGTTHLLLSCRICLLHRHHFSEYVDGTEEDNSKIPINYHPNKCNCRRFVYI